MGRGGGGWGHGGGGRGGWGSGASDSDGGWLASGIDGLMLKCQNLVNKTLKIGKFSEDSIHKAIALVEDYAAKIDAKIEKLSNGPFAKFVKADDAPPSVYVESAGKASGDNAEVNNHVKLGVFDTKSAKLIIASAESYAAADGDHSNTFVNTFSKVNGVDTGSINTFYEKGSNFEKAVETLVAIDFSAYDREWVFKKHHKFYSKHKADLDPGYTMHASTDVHAEVDNGAELNQSIEQLAIGNTLEGTASVDGTFS